MDRVSSSGSRFRTVLISDLHLGSPRCDAVSVLDFLQRSNCDSLYLVGDIVDLWSFRRRAAWRQQHLAVVRRILDMARQGTRVVLVPGNHDEPLLHMGEFGLAGIEVAAEAVLRTRNGAHYLVVHGHEADRWLGSTSEAVGGLYGLGEWIGQILPPLRRRSGAKGPQTRPGLFEQTLAGRARSRAMAGVICGHSHRPADFDVDGVRYLNCGDWLSNRTAVVEDLTGHLRLIRWGATFALPARPTPVAGHAAASPA